MAPLHMMHELSPALADYLGELHRLSQTQETVLSADVAAALGVSKASACRATDSLWAFGYIQKQRYVKGITLTAQGRAYAEALAERRAVIAAFLQKTESSPLRVGSSTRQNNSAFTTFETN